MNATIINLSLGSICLSSSLIDDGCIHYAFAHQHFFWGWFARSDATPIEGKLPSSFSLSLLFTPLNVPSEKALPFFTPFFFDQIHVRKAVQDGETAWIRRRAVGSSIWQTKKKKRNRKATCFTVGVFSAIQPRVPIFGTPRPLLVLWVLWVVGCCRRARLVTSLQFLFTFFF